MVTDKFRKYVLPNIPYVFIGWVFLKLGTAYRLAAGGDFAHKFIGLGQTVGAAFADFAPGLALFDWLVGIVGAVAFRLLIYFKSKNAKKYRRDAEYWIFFKWIFKTACAILILSNTFNIVMAVFDVSQSVIARAAGIVQGSTDISEAMLADLEATLETLGLGSLLGLWLQSLLIHVTMWAINIVIFVIVYGRMIEIYLLTSLAPIPVATLSNRELGNTGQNYLKSLFAVGFQGLLILVCVAIYAVLIQGIATGGDPIGAIWGCMGYSVLLCFCLFKTGSIARSVFSAH